MTRITGIAMGIAFSKKNIHGLKQRSHSYGFPIGKVGKQGLKGRLFSGGQVQIEPGIAHFDNTAQNEIQDPQHDCR